MTSVYINYPNPHFSIRHGVTAESRMRREKAGRRVLQVTPDTLGVVVRTLADSEFRFAPTSELNDLWLDMEFGDPEFELAVVRYLQGILGRRYSPLRDAEWRM